MMNLLKNFGDRFMTLIESLPVSIEAVINALVISYLWLLGSYLFYRCDPQVNRSGVGIETSVNLYHPYVWSLLGASICGGLVLLGILIDFDRRRPMLCVKHVAIWTLLYVPLGIAYFTLPW
jgi:hypothetical protein